MAAGLELVRGYRETGPAIVDAALVQILGCLLLARLEGDSPVDYLADLNVAATKDLAVHLLRDPVASSPLGAAVLETSA